ncbi:DUF6338 family protein [Streptomyces sp. NPDC102270]|uniref:DUF6338 family protein n=1 Tax=Streptomyces sp. NPDC102270 TaxID=3366150 RepID=UPI003817F59B
MTIPTTAYAVSVFLVLVLPGIVYGVVRATVSGTRPHDRGWTPRVLQAILVSILLNTLYLLVLGKTAVIWVTGGTDTLRAHPRLAALAVLCLGLLVPALLAYLRHGEPRWREVRVIGRFPVRVPARGTTNSPVPTAWDQVASRLEGRWVRIRLSDGRWVGGWFATKSFVSTYPEPRDIFIEDQHHIAPDGTIGDPVNATAGVWVSLKDGDIVEWLRP